MNSSNTRKTWGSWPMHSEASPRGDGDESGAAPDDGPPEQETITCACGSTFDYERGRAVRVLFSADPCSICDAFRRGMELAAWQIREAIGSVYGIHSG